MKQTFEQLEAEKAYHKMTLETALTEAQYARDKGEITDEACEEIIEQVKFDFDVIMDKIKSEQHKSWSRRISGASYV